MAEDKADLRESAGPPAPAWTELFRTFQVALDPTKLALAAAGILAMCLGWFVLSLVFYGAASEPKFESDARYSTNHWQNSLPKEAKPEEVEIARKAAYERDLAAFRLLEQAAGPDGDLRALPWDQYRGPNPLLFLSGQAGSFTDPTVYTAYGQVLVEPLVKLVKPIYYLLSPNSNLWNQFYFMLVILWSLAVWAFFGGVITRLAVVQLAGKDRLSLSLREAVRFVTTRYLAYLSAPLVPLLIIAAITIGLSVLGFLQLAPLVGEITINGVLYPLVLAGGAAIAILLLGLLAYPLMFTTISTEGSDTFDALSRSYNYFYTAFWSYLWYSAVAIVYGAVLMFIVVFMGSLIVYGGKWASSQTPGTVYLQREPEYLYLFTPTSFGWQELLTADNPATAKVALKSVPPLTPAARAALVKSPEGKTLEDTQKAAKEARAAYLKTLGGHNYPGVFFVTLFVGLVFLLTLGFAYSYFWVASSMLYLLMRQKVDDTELDEVYLEEDEPEEPIGPPPAAQPRVQMVEAPTLRSPPPASTDAAAPVGAAVATTPAPEPTPAVTAPPPEPPAVVPTPTPAPSAEAPATPPDATVPPPPV
jgi:hypothetical protein